MPNKEPKRILIYNHTSTNVRIRITNLFRRFDDITIKPRNELSFLFKPYETWFFDEYFWLKVWYKDYYVKLIAYGKERGFNNFIYKIKKDGITCKPIGSTESSKYLVKWDEAK